MLHTLVWFGAACIVCVSWLCRPFKHLMVKWNTEFKL